MALTAIWTATSIQIHNFPNRDKGLVVGLGFLLTLSTSIFIGQELKGYLAWIKLSAVVITTYLIGSFALLPILTNVLSTTQLDTIYPIANSLFVTVVITHYMNSTVGIEFKWTTGSFIFLSLLLGYFLLFSESISLIKLCDHLSIIFVVFQLLLIIPLNLGMNINTLPIKESK